MRVLRFHELKSKKGIPWTRQHVDRLIKLRRFPGKRHLGDNTVVWFENEIDDYLKAKLAERDAELIAGAEKLASFASPAHDEPLHSRADQGRSPVADAMTRAEREDLQRLIRQREKTLKTVARQRNAELLVDFAPPSDRNPPRVSGNHGEADR